MESGISAPPGPKAYVKTPKKAAASGWIGSALEYYDFFIYAQAAALVFPTVFFPQTDPQVAIIASFATFGVGYAARPLGAFVLGHWGDTHGRKNMLVTCMLIIGIATFCVALLPTYGQAGLAAPALLVALRLVQGFAVGGEISGASAMILEHAPFGRRGYYTSFTLQGVQAGQLIAAAVFLPLSATMSEEAFLSWGWRIPFLLSAVVVIAGVIIRRKVDETPAFQEQAARGQVPKAPIVLAVRESGGNMVRVFLMALLTVIPATVNTFGATFATSDSYGNGFSTTTYLWISVMGNVCAVVLIPYVGRLSDNIGRRPLMIAGALGSTAMGYTYLRAIEDGERVLAFASAVLMWGVAYQAWNACFPTFFQELFPTRTRVTAFAVSQNLGTMVAAFFPVLFAAWAPPGSNVPLIVGGFCVAIGIVVAVTAYTATETFRLEFDDLGIRGRAPLSREAYNSRRAALTSPDDAHPAAEPPAGPVSAA